MILTAIPAGLSAGLFGLGGGLITVPIMFYIFMSAGIEVEYLMHLSVGTSFAIIIPTSLVSVFTHYQHKSIEMKIVKDFGIYVILGVILGTFLAANLKTKPLILFFTFIVYLFSFYLLFFKDKESKLKISMSRISKIISAFLSGFISAPMGIGGGVMNVPILKFFGYPIHKAIGSAAAIGLIIVTFGAIGFLISGTYLNVNLPYSVGFINIPAFCIFFPITALMARYGAKLSHRLDKNRLVKYFGLYLIIVGSKFLFDYIRI